jgi:hypothetical protein
MTNQQCVDKALADSDCWKEEGMVQIFKIDGVSYHWCHCATMRNPTKTHSQHDYGAWFDQDTTCMKNIFYGPSCTKDSDCNAVKAEGNYQCTNGVCNPCEICDAVPSDCETIIPAVGKCGCSYCGDETPRKVGKNWAPVAWHNAIKRSPTSITVQQCHNAVKKDTKCEKEADGRYVFFINKGGNVWFCVCNANKATDFGSSKPFRWVSAWIKDDIYSVKPAAAEELNIEVETEIGTFKDSVGSLNMFFLLAAIVLVIGFFAGRHQGQKVAETYKPLVSMATYQTTQE